MEAVGRRVETTGRQIARAGHELWLAVSLPVGAPGLLAFYAEVERWEVTFGRRFQAFEHHKAAGTSRCLDLGTVLGPAFLKLSQGVQLSLSRVTRPRAA